MLVKSLIGLVFMLLITFVNLILSRKKTLMVMLTDQLVWGLVVFLIFGWITIIYSVLLTGFLIFIKIRNHQKEEADLDYSGRILSYSAVWNRFIKPKSMIVGRVFPTNHKELPHNQKCIGLDNVVLSGGTLITGSMGSGKTTTLKLLMKQRINERKPVVFFDYKGETEILDDIEEMAKQANIPYYEFSSRACTFTYDPFVDLDETGKVEALMNTRRWSEDGADEFYKNSMQLACQSLVREYDAYRGMKDEKINYIIGLYKFSETYKPKGDERDGVNNLRTSLKILISSRASELFRDNPNFSFQTDEPYVVCFSFVSANKKLANNISSYVFTDMMDRGTKRPYKDKLLLCIDEFGTIESSIIIKDLVEKARSVGIQTVLSILDINQISMNAGEHFVEAILGSINSYMIHAGATQRTAELLAGVQKFDKSFDIMSLQKPYRGRKPTVLFITKYGIINKKYNQTMFRIIPYSEVLNIKPNPNSNTEEDDKPKVYNYEIEEETPMEEEVYIDITPAEELDLDMPIDNVDNYL